VQYFGAAGSKVEQFTVAAADGTEQVITVTINGSNDVPVAGNALTSSTNEGLGTLNLRLTGGASDFGVGDILGVSHVT
jgi:VCBS repeat-containing protein